MLNTVEQVKKYVNEKVNEHLSNRCVSVRYSNRMSSCLGRCEESRLYHTIKLVFNMKFIKANLGNGNHIENTVLHEIAHALAGGLHHHDSYWVSVCRAIGGNGERLANSKSLKFYNTYVYKCKHCGRIVEVHSKFRANRACCECCDKYNNGEYSHKYLLRLIEVKSLT